MQQDVVKKKGVIFPYYLTMDEHPFLFADGWPIEEAWLALEKHVSKQNCETIEDVWNVFVWASKNITTKEWCRTKFRYFYEVKLPAIVRNNGHQ